MKQKDEEIERLEGEVAGYRDDIDNMFTSFQKREQELRQEMATAETKNQVSNRILSLDVSIVEGMMEIATRLHSGSTSVFQHCEVQIEALQQSPFHQHFFRTFKIHEWIEWIS